MVAINQNILWAIGIIGLYVMSSSKLFYFTSGVFIGVNYHNHLKPYTDMAQTEAVKKLEELEKSQDIKIPGIDYIKPVQEPEIPEPISISTTASVLSKVSSITNWITRTGNTKNPKDKS